MAEKIKTYKRVKTPTVLQMEAVECGAACLAMIMGYYRRFVPLSQVRKDCGVSRDGSKASNIVAAAEGYGLKGDGFKKDPSDLQHMKPPMVLHWNFNHFVVLEGISGDKVYINDPAEGKRIVSRKVLDESFTGIVLTFEKTDKFKEGGKRRTIWDALKDRFKGIKLGISFVFLSGISLIVPGLAIPVISQQFVDRVIVSKVQGWVTPLILGILFMAVLEVFITRLQSSYLYRLREKIDVTSSSGFFWHVLKLPMEFFYQRYAGDISNRLESNSELAGVLSSSFASTGINIFRAVFYLSLMLQYDLLLTAVAVASGGLNLFFMRYISKYQANNSKKLYQEQGKLYSTSISGIQLIESIKAGGGEAGFFSKWSGHHTKLLDFEQEIGEQNIYASVVPSFLMSLNGILILGLGALQVLRGNMTIGMLVAFQGIIGNFLGPLNAVISFFSGLQSLKGSTDRLDDVMDSKIDPMFKMSGMEPESVTKNTKVKLDGYIELKDVTFGYSPLEPPLIENFNLKLKPGSRIALVGMSGSGKSTITKVVSGLYRQWSGDIFLDGQNRDDIPRELLNNSIAVIDQEIISFEASIRDNIKLWDKTISDAEMIKACKDANIHDDIIARKEGYDFVVKESTSGFSGGQLQRIEIARALATNPTVMIMDEATSNLDTRTEKFIDDSVRKRGCTTIIVAHRLSTIRDSDEIIVLNRGKVEQRGTHEELMKQKGLYAALIKAS